MAAPKTAVAVPKAKLNLPANLEADMANEIAQFKGRLGAPTGRKIETKGKIFTLPNGEQSDTMRVIIVDFMARNEYYEAAWVKGVQGIPNCFSIGTELNSMVPSENSPEKQHDNCKSCWANQFESGQGKGKACNNTRLLAVIAPDGDSDTPLLILKVTSTALKSFDAYVTSVIQTLQRPPRGVITQITFDPTLDFSSLRFSNPQACTPEQMALAYSRREEAMQLLTQEPDVSKFVPAAKPKGKALRKAA